MFLILVALALATLFYLGLIKPLTFWTRKGIPQKSIFELWVDNLRMLFRQTSLAEINIAFYGKFSDKRYSGSYQFFKPMLTILDPDLIKQIAVRDFDHFVDHDKFLSEEQEPLWGKNLLSLKGDRWRRMRATLSPSFTSSKMRTMFALINECAQQLTRYLKEHQHLNNIEMKDVFTRFATDVIGSTAFGITCDSLKHPNNEFYLMGKEASSPTGLWNGIKFLIFILAPNVAEVLGLRVFSKTVSGFFRRLVKTNIESREKNGIVRHDMIHLLMEAKKGKLTHDVVDPGIAVIEESSLGKDEKYKHHQLTDDDLTAQALIFFFAGFESVSSLMCFIAYEIALNPEVQQTLLKEVDATLSNTGGAITYEDLLKMKYLDMVVSEGLRKWPAIIFTDRVCVKPYTIQPEAEEKPLSVNEGDVLVFPIYGIHRSAKFYPNPDKFDPERFSDRNKLNIHPYAYIPFGPGPRSCIGNRFALLETKLVLFHILTNYVIKVTDKTAIPIKISKTQFSLTSGDGFWLGLKPRVLRYA